MNIIVDKIAMRTSRKYGTYAVFDGENLEGEKLHCFTMSAVLTSQAAALLEKYGSDDEGNLSNPILASVVSKNQKGVGFTSHSNKSFLPCYRAHPLSIKYQLFAPSFCK